MGNCAWNLRYIFLLVAAIQLQPTMTLYEDLSSKCLTNIRSKHFRSLIPNMTYTATPYPYVTKETNITLQCTGSVKINPGNQGYISRVAIRKNGKELHECSAGRSSRLKTLSCNVTVTGVTSNDTFLCLIVASRAPCNAAQMSFQIDNKLPKPNNIYLAKITSKEAVVRWEKISSNPKTVGVLLGYKLMLIGSKRKSNFTLANDTNYLVLSDLLPKSNYTLSIRGFTQCCDGYTSLFSFASLDVIPAPKNVEAVMLSKNSVGIQWSLIKQREEKYDKIIGYRVNVRNATHSFKVDALSVTYSVVLRDLSPKANYSVSVFGFGNGTKGISSNWIYFQINDPDSENGNAGGTSEDRRNFTLTIVVVLIVGMVIGAIFVLIAVYLLGRRGRGTTNSQNITTVKYAVNQAKNIQ